MRRRGSDEDDPFGPGTDLALSLFAVAVCGFAVAVRAKWALASELRGSHQELADARTNTRTISAADAIELESLREQTSNQQSALANYAQQLEKSASQLTVAAAREKELEQQLAMSKQRIDKIGEQVLNPIKTAQLVVSVECAELPEGVDLDLFVQDPADRLSWWLYPRQREGEDEITAMILSEDISNISGKTQEFYCSKKVLQQPDAPYLLGCMLRRAEKKSDDLERLNVKVHWRVELKDGGTPQIREGTKDVTYVGNVFIKRIATTSAPATADPLGIDADKTFAGQYVLQGFRITKSSPRLIEMLPAAEVPAYFRRFGEAKLESGSPKLGKIRDQGTGK